RANSYRVVPEGPAHSRRVCIHPPRHPPRAQVVHRKEGQVESNYSEPEVNLAQVLVHQPSSDLGPPVIESRKQGECAAAKQNIMKMRNHKICISLLQIDWWRRVHYAAQPSDGEFEDKT